MNCNVDVNLSVSVRKALIVQVCVQYISIIKLSGLYNDMGLIKLKRSDSFVAAQKFFRFLAEFIMWEDLPMVAFDARVVVWVVPVTGNAVVTLMQVSISPHAFSVLGSHFRQVRLRHQPTLFTSCILFGLTFIRRTDVIFIASSFTMGLINSLYFFINTIHIPSGLSDN